MMKLSHLMTLTTGLSLGLGCFSNQEAIAATLGPDFAGKTIQEISLIVDQVSITPQESSTDYTLGLRVKVSFLDEEQEGEETWFINRNATFFNIVGSLFTLNMDFCASSAPFTCYSLFDNPITITNNTLRGREFSKNDDEVEGIVKLLTNGTADIVTLDANLVNTQYSSNSDGLPSVNFQQSTSESIFFVSTPPIEPAVVPEPLTLLGSATAIGFGSFFKRKLGTRKFSSKKA
ncbi:PEP-CTERM sorting domain-containing protein [Crocosphaera subtropica]|nr:PEP-CTERM sorting domain-containing protein [Crocosphaera subtropica]